MAKGRVALVTGSGRRRVGNVIARDLASAGYRVAIHYHTSKEEAQQTVAELQSQGVDAIAVGADLRDEQQVRTLVDEVTESFGRLDALICAAASWLKHPFADTTSEQMRAEWETNTLSTFLCCQAAGLVMVEQPEGGCLITIGDWSMIRPYVEHAAYFAAKGSLPTLTRTLAVELAARNPNVRANCILPGPVMMPEHIDEDERQRIVKATLVQREGKPENVAHAVRFLLENDFVTGICLPVDGGRSVYAGGL